MKVPVEIDLRRASLILCQFGERIGVVEKVNLGSGTSRSNGPVTPFQIIARASVACVNRD